jgi:hypothetical protein
MKPRKVGDTGYPITATLMAGSSPRDLTGSTVVLYVSDARTKVVKINGATVTVVSPTAGTVSYTPTSSDVDTAGVYDLEFKETLAGGHVIHYPSGAFDRLVLLRSLG